MLLFEYDLDILDTRNLGLVFFPVLLHNAVLFFKRCLADVVEKGQSSNSVGKSLFAVSFENTLFKDKFLQPFRELDLWTCEPINA